MADAGGISTGIFSLGFLPAALIAAECTNRRRRISPEAGHALETLAHAIEYLTDEFLHEEGVISGDDPQLRAIQLLMMLNRQIYNQCPFVPTIRERLHTFLHFLNHGIVNLVVGKDQDRDR